MMHPFALLLLAATAAEAPTQRVREPDPWPPRPPPVPLTPQERNALQEREEQMARWRHEQDAKRARKAERNRGLEVPR